MREGKKNKKKNQPASSKLSYSEPYSGPFVRPPLRYRDDEWGFHIIGEFMSCILLDCVSV